MIKLSDNLDEIAGRLRVICTLDYDGNASELGRQLDISSATVSRALNGEFEKSVNRVATVLVEEQGYNQRWIETGEGERKGESVHPTQEKSHKPSSQSDIGLSPTSHDTVNDKSNPVKERGPMELIHQPGFVGSPICEYVDVFLGGQCVATIQHHRVEPGTRKRLDITDEALWQRYAPQIPEHKEEGPPANR